MIKFSRFLFILGLMLSVLGCVSLVINLVAGRKMIDAAITAGSDQLKAKLDQAKAELDYLETHIPQKVLELVAALGCGIAGIIYSTATKKDRKFWILSGAALLLSASQIVAKSYLLGTVYVLAGLLTFIAVSKGIKPPAPVTSARF